MFIRYDVFDESKMDIDVDLVPHLYKISDGDMVHAVIISGSNDEPVNNLIITKGDGTIITLAESRFKEQIFEIMSEITDSICKGKNVYVIPCFKFPRWKERGFESKEAYTKHIEDLRR